MFTNLKNKTYNNCNERKNNFFLHSNSGYHLNPTLCTSQIHVLAKHALLFDSFSSFFHFFFSLILFVLYLLFFFFPFFSFIFLKQIPFFVLSFLFLLSFHSCFLFSCSSSDSLLLHFNPLVFFFILSLSYFPLTNVLLSLHRLSPIFWPFSSSHFISFIPFIL